MHYKIYRNGTSELNCREDLNKASELTIEFDGAAEGSYAVINTKRSKRYRQIVDGKVSIPVPRESTLLTVTYVEQYGDLANTWQCPPVDVIVTDGVVMIRPNLTGITDEINGLKEQLNNLQSYIQSMQDEITVIKGKIATLLEGYNII